MRKLAETEKPIQGEATSYGWDVVRVPSKSSPNKFYIVDITLGRCSCPSWVFQKGGDRHPCKHLRELGFHKIVAIADLKEPKKFSKADKELLPVVQL